jgi:hypothetical protein
VLAPSVLALVRLVEVTGIELKATLKARKLLIPQNDKREKNHKNAEPRYTPGVIYGGQAAIWMSAPCC